MAWIRTLLGIVALVTLALMAHPPAVLALIEVRSGPGVTYEVIAHVPPGSCVAVAQEQDWYKIQLPDGRAGWAHKYNLVQAQPPSRTAPLVAPPPAMSSPTAPPAPFALPSTAQPPAVTPGRTVETGSAPPMARRTALVIGNTAYAEGPLQNAVKDATDIAALLRRVGFEVILLRDVPLQEMEEAVQAFHLRLRAGGVGLFYFAGHGVQVDGENYLIPVKARILLQKDVRYLALPMGRVIGAMEEAGNGLNILILDACRDLPLARSWRSSQAGLAPPPTARGMLIAYATAPGGRAADGTGGENGVYTKHLLQAMPIAGLSIEQVFKQVRSGVVAETAGQQTPWESSSLLGEFAFVPAQATLVPPGVFPSSASAPEPVPGQQQRPPEASVPAAPLPRVAEFSPSPATSAAPQQPSERAVSSNVSSAHTPHAEAGRTTPMNQPSLPPSSEGYWLIRRIYCEDRESGVIQGTMDLRVMSPLSCEEAKNLLLLWEQQKDHCRFPKEDKTFVVPTVRESQRKAKEWIGTSSCHSPS